MPQINNGPAQETVLQLAARKSFALGVFVTDKNENPLDLGGTDMTIVMRKKTSSSVVDDSSNLIVNHTAVNEAPLAGFARFNLQASDLDHPAGEYEFGITLLSEGYSSLIIKGTIELQQNPEFSSVGSSYSGDDTATNLTVQLRDNASIKVAVGPTLAPGEATFTTALENKLLEMYAGLAAAGLTLTADDIVDGTTHVMMTLTERNTLAAMQAYFDALPVFGDIVTHDADEFRAAGDIDAGDIATGVLHKDRVPRFLDLRGVVVGTAAASGGADGDAYLQREP